MTGDANAWRPRRVLIGYDGTDGGRDAIALARALAEPDAEFLLVDVIPPVGIVAIRPRRLEDEEPPQSQGFFLEALRDLSGREVETRTYVANSTAHVLTEIVDDDSGNLALSVWENAYGRADTNVWPRLIIGRIINSRLLHNSCASSQAITEASI